MARADLEPLASPRGLSAAKASLLWREGEGRRRMVRTHEHKFVTDPMGDLDELYDLRLDPSERRNVAGHPAYASVALALAQVLHAWDEATPTRSFTPPPAPRLTTPPPKGRTA